MHAPKLSEDGVPSQPPELEDESSQAKTDMKGFFFARPSYMRRRSLVSRDGAVWPWLVLPVLTGIWLALASSLSQQKLMVLVLVLLLVLVSVPVLVLVRELVPVQALRYGHPRTNYTHAQYIHLVGYINL